MVFGTSGFMLSTWAARLPSIRDKLDLTPEQLGVLLLFLSLGSLLMLPFAGPLVQWAGPAWTISASATVSMVAAAAMGIAANAVTLAAALVVYGAGIGSWDVAMNVEAASVERLLGRNLMTRFHAGYSLGAIAGAAIGVAAAGVHLPVRVHLPVAATLSLFLVLVAANWLRPADNPGVVPIEPGMSSARDQAAAGVAASGPGTVHRGLRRGRLGMWADPATLLIGLLVFCMALAEGSANDWLALSLVDDYGVVNALGAIGVAVFVTGMTGARMAGPYILSRYDPVLVMRLSALLVLAGSGLLIVGAWVAEGEATVWEFVVGAAAALLWGLGAALGFPMGMTAAAAEPVNAATRIAVVSTIAYVAFIAGPPLIGALGQRIGTAPSLLIVTIAALPALLTAHAVRRPDPD